MRITLPLAALAAAGALLLTGTPASAATGTLTLLSPTGFKQYTDLKPGCYPGTGPDTLAVNHTDSRVLLFPDGRCLTKVLWPVEPGQSLPGHTVGSVRILT
jgi:hypothetical protein